MPLKKLPWMVIALPPPNGPCSIACSSAQRPTPGKTRPQFWQSGYENLAADTKVQSLRIYWARKVSYATHHYRRQLPLPRHDKRDPLPHFIALAKPCISKNNDNGKWLILVWPSLIMLQMNQFLATGLTPIRDAPDPGPPKAQTKLWSSFGAALARPTRWSSLAVASNIVGQLGLLVATGKWPLQPPTENTMRGVDFYPWKDFLRALIHGAHLFKAENGYLPRLATPTSFNEHMFVRKFFAPLPMPSLADKLAAKEHVKARVGDEFLPAVVWVGDDVGGLFAAKLPAGRYVLKANHGWNANLFLNLPDDLSAKRDEIEQRATRWLTSRFGYDWGEWQYCTFKPKLFLEEFIDFNGAQTPDDYKFYCFRGKVCLIEVDVDRFTDLRSAFYTPDWKHIPVTYGERANRTRTAAQSRAT